MIEPLIVITFSILQLHCLALALPMSESEFNCIEIPSNNLLERGGTLSSHTTSTLPHGERSFINISRQRLHTPCFNASFPASLTVEEGNDVILPCVVHNVDFDSIVMSWWKERAVREIAVGDIISDKRFSIDKSIRGGWSLRIANVSLRDSGVYICQINSRQLRERFVSLSVTAKRSLLPAISSSDVLVKDEAIHPGQSPNPSSQGSHWKPFLPAVGYEWMQLQITSSVSFSIRFTPMILAFCILHLLAILTVEI